jgi:hypothetical protein
VRAEGERDPWRDGACAPSGSVVVVVVVVVVIEVILAPWILSHPRVHRFSDYDNDYDNDNDNDNDNDSDNDDGVCV